MARLRVREVGGPKGSSISKIHFATRMSMATARRYWYGTTDGKEDGKPLTEVDLNRLKAIADELGVRIADLIDEES